MSTFILVLIIYGAITVGTIIDVILNWRYKIWMKKK